MPLQEFYRYEGDELRIQGGADDSGVRFSGKPRYRKWILSHRISRRWVEDAAVYLPNTVGVKEAKIQFGF